MEEKYKNEGYEEGDDDDEESSSDEEEDEEGFLATEALDAQISATLQALRSKDPKVYDKDVTFYKSGDEDGEDDAQTNLTERKQKKKEKPIYLKDYQREKLLRGDTGASDDDDNNRYERDGSPAPPTFSQEQEALKKSIISEMHGANDDSDADSDDDFVVKRSVLEKPGADGVNPARAKTIKKADVNPQTANRDPETFLSNFMAARAWVPEEGSRWEAFESDEGDDDENNDRAEEFEQAYNMRFEDPARSNEVLKSYARDVAAERSVRRDDATGRKRRREAEKEKKEEEKRLRKEEKARLRKLKLDETEQKLKKIKQAAGAAGLDLKDEDWIKFLDDAWDNDKWEEEMSKRFGEDYYATNDAGLQSDDGEGSTKSKRKYPKKPTWDDDIDIKDIVPDFEDDEANPKITLSDDEGEDNGDVGGGDEEEDEEDDHPSKKRKTKDHKRARLDAQKQARKDRSKLEALVDSKMELDNPDVLASSSSGVGPFRYQQTEPLSFGMTARDILLAPSDAALNDFAGLKKLAHWRPEEKKYKDKKRLGKKGRLREWRRDTFGRDYERSGPTYGFEKLAEEDEEAPAARILQVGEKSKQQSGGGEDDNVVGDVGGSRKKRKRSKNKSKDKSSVEA